MDQDPSAPRRIPFWPAGIQRRAITHSILLVVCAVAAVSVVQNRHEYQAQLDSLTEDARVDAMAMSCNAEPALLLNDRKALQRVVDAAEAETSIGHAAVLDAQGRLLAEFKRSEDFVSEAEPRTSTPGADDRGLLRLELTSNQLHVAVPVRAKDPDLDLQVPVEEDESRELPPTGPIGYVTTTYSLEGFRQERQKSIASVAGAALVVVLAGIILTSVFMRKLLDPVRDLADKATRIAGGDLTQRASTDALGEIGMLARAFNGMADSLARYTEDLESQVQCRTSELQRRTADLEAEVAERRRVEAELREATCRAEAASKAKSEFLANMSHEIRTPMTAILGFSETLSDPQLSETQRQDAVRSVRRNGEHLVALINDILDISRIEAGRLEVVRASCSPLQVVAEVESIMRARAREKGLTFEVEYHGRIPETILTDETRLRQILINLVGNAVKFTERGGIRTRVQLLAEAGLMRFDVIDTGIGINSDSIDDLFKPFSQVDTSLTRRFGGAGLGLMISKRLAVMLGGELTVQSEPARGSTFTATIATGPLDGVKMAERRAIDHSAAAEPQRPAALDQPLNCRILLAEDGPDNQRLITFILRKAGAEVDVAANGQEALDAVAAAPSRHDLILMDMQMPVLDGYEATRRLRQAGHTGPIVALTAHAMSSDREKCLGAGCDDYATKPIDRAKLLSVIRAQVSRVVTT